MSQSFPEVIINCNVDDSYDIPKLCYFTNDNWNDNWNDLNNYN